MPKVGVQLISVDWPGLRAWYGRPPASPIQRCIMPRPMSLSRALWMPIVCCALTERAYSTAGATANHGPEIGTRLVCTERSGWVKESPGW